MLEPLYNIYCHMVRKHIKYLLVEGYPDIKLLGRWYRQMKILAVGDLVW